MTQNCAISTVTEGGVLLRGYPLEDLVASSSFASVMYLSIRGELPDARTARMIEAILISAVDHGPDAPSIHIARASASCGVPLSTAVASGIASIGTTHGGAGEACARLLQESIARLHGSSAKGDPATTTVDVAAIAAEAEALAARSRASGTRIPGYGHRVYKDKDPRAETLLELARSLGLEGDHQRLARALSQALERTLVEALKRPQSPPLVLNVDGAQAAILSDLGIPWSQVMSFFIVGRCLGLCAHAGEQIAEGRPLGYLSSAPLSAHYTGPSPRPFVSDRGIRDDWHNSLSEKEKP